MTRKTDPKRDAVLGSIRQSLGRGPISKTLKKELDERVRKPQSPQLPARAKGNHEELVEHFVAMAEAAQCSVRRIASFDDLPSAVTDYLREHNLPTSLAVAPDDLLDGVDWSRESMLERHRGAARADDLASLTPAYAAVAETGTLIAASGANHPTTLNMMPDHHLVALRTSQIVGGYEEVWDRLRKDGRKGTAVDLPRTVNMITGPSRTGDIELTIHLGAHGPRSLHVLLIDDEEAAEGR